MLSDNQPKSHRARNIAAVIIVVVILSAALFVILRPHPYPTPIVNSIVNGLITVNPSSYKDYPFTIYSDVSMIKVEVTFTVSGSSNESNIKLYIMDDANFANWKNGNAFSTYYNSGETTTGDLTVESPPGGTYYIVFDNTFSTASKNIETAIDTIFLPVD